MFCFFAIFRIITRVYATIMISMTYAIVQESMGAPWGDICAIMIHVCLVHDVPACVKCYLRVQCAGAHIKPLYRTRRSFGAVYTEKRRNT